LRSDVERLTGRERSELALSEPAGSAAEGGTMPLSASEASLLGPAWELLRRREAFRREGRHPAGETSE
jgi:hypothetical protein